MTAACPIQVISADPTWRENLDYTIALVNKRGGPQALLREEPGNFTRRYLLESLTAHDVFSE
jgi:hypothetical protein